MRIKLVSELTNFISRTKHIEYFLTHRMENILKVNEGIFWFNVSYFSTVFMIKKNNQELKFEHRFCLSRNSECVLDFFFILSSLVPENIIDYL